MGDAICGCFGNPFYDPIAECKICKYRVRCKKAIDKEIHQAAKTACQLVRR